MLGSQPHQSTMFVGSQLGFTLLLSTLILLLFPLHTSSLQLNTLVLEGGGVRGAVYAGAVVALEEMGHLSTIKNFGGTSAGASAAAMLAAGYTACEFSDATLNTDFADLVEFSLFDRLKRALFGDGTSALARLVGKQKGKKKYSPIIPDTVYSF